MNTLVVCLEEASVQALFEGVFPRLLPTGWVVRYIRFNGKQDLEKNLLKRLRGWLMPHSRFLVMRDQDAGNCVCIKKKLTDLCEQAGQPDALVRVACRELKSFYFGDMEAVEKGLGLCGIAKRKNKGVSYK